MKLIDGNVMGVIQNAGIEGREGVGFPIKDVAGRSGAQFIATDGGAVTLLDRFVYFPDGQTQLKPATWENFVKQARNAEVAIGFRLIDAVWFNFIIVVGDIDQEDLAVLEQPGRQVRRIPDPEADDARQQLHKFLISQDR
jgi:hypothetical protein